MDKNTLILNNENQLEIISKITDIKTLVVRNDKGEYIIKYDTAKKSENQKTFRCPFCLSEINYISSSIYGYFELLNKLLKRSTVPEKPNANNTNQNQDYNEHIPEHLILNNYYKTFFKEIRLLGKGAFGKVYLCYHILDNIDLGLFAVKKIPVGDSRLWLQKIIKEVKMREALNHENIVSYKHSWLEIFKSDAIDAIPTPWLYVLMEYCSGGDLEELINTVYIKDESFLSEDEIFLLIDDIISGLQHLHHRSIVHRDLKPSNIMLKHIDEIIFSDVKSKQIYAAVADFGTSEYVFSSRSGQGYTGTLEYTAPELFINDEQGLFCNSYDFKNDIWSAGILLYYMTFGSLPFEINENDPIRIRELLLNFREFMNQDSDNINAYLKKAHPYLKVCRSKELLTLIRNMLESKPKDRPSTEMILDIVSFSSEKKARIRQTLAQRFKTYNSDSQENIDKDLYKNAIEY